MKANVYKLLRTMENYLNIGQANKREQAESQELLDLIKQAHLEWQVALNNFNYCQDEDIIDYSIYQIEATEKRYMFLLKIARKENLAENTNLTPILLAEQEVSR